MRSDGVTKNASPIHPRSRRFLCRVGARLGIRVEAWRESGKPGAIEKGRRQITMSSIRSPAGRAPVRGAYVAIGRARDEAARVVIVAGFASIAARLIFAACHAVARHWPNDQPSDSRRPSRKRLWASRMTAARSKRWVDCPCMGKAHLQAARRRWRNIGKGEAPSAMPEGARRDAWRREASRRVATRGVAPAGRS